MVSHLTSHWHQDVTCVYDKHYFFNVMKQIMFFLSKMPTKYLLWNNMTKLTLDYDWIQQTSWNWVLKIACKPVNIIIIPWDPSTKHENHSLKMKHSTLGVDLTYVSYRTLIQSGFVNFLIWTLTATFTLTSFKWYIKR